jgi:transposase-like protein
VTGAAPYERTASRTNERNGCRPRLLATQAGDIEFTIPKFHKGTFFPSISEPRRRIDAALRGRGGGVAGVSTRAVDDLVAALGIASADFEVRGVTDLLKALAGSRYDMAGNPGVAAAACGC